MSTNAKKPRTVKSRKVEQTKQTESTEPKPTQLVEEPVVVQVVPVVEQQPSHVNVDEPASEEEVVGSEDKQGKKQKIVSTVLIEIESIQNVLQKYQTDHKDQKNNEVNRLVRNIEKSIKKINSQIKKLNKSKSVAGGSGQGGSGNMSGFQKPVHISEAVAQFTGWETSQPRARVEVTNYICDYIKQNKLQKPGDGRVILADKKLKELLDYQEEKDGTLTYATIQKLLARHYTPLKVN